MFAFTIFLPIFSLICCETLDARSDDSKRKEVKRAKDDSFLQRLDLNVCLASYRTGWLHDTIGRNELSMVLAARSGRTTREDQAGSVGEARRNEISLNENSVARGALVNRADLRKRGVAAKFMRLTNPSRGTTYLCKAASSTLLFSRPP